MPDLETLRENDEALNAMYKGDTQDGAPLSAEDEQAYKELIEEQRTDYKDTLYEKKDADGKVTTEIAPSIGDAALHNSLTPEQTAQREVELTQEDWRKPKS